jgi:O-antigen/teichoic acid export membrane protein
MSKSILSTATLYVSGSVITQAITFISQIVLMRSLTLSDYGFYGLSFEVLILLQMVIGGAFRNFYLQSFRNKNDNVNDLTCYQVVNGSFYITLFSVLLYFLYGVDWIISLSLTLSFVLSSFALPLQTKMLADNQRMRLIFKDIITAAVSLATILLTVKIFHFPIRLVVIVQLIPTVIVAFVFIFFYQRDFFTYWDSKIIKQYVRVKYEKVLISFILIFLVNSLHNRLGVLYIKHFSELSVLALYIASFKFINPTLFVQSSLIQAYMPKFVSDKNFIFDIKIFITFMMPGFLIALFLIVFFPFIISALGLTLYQNTYPLVQVGVWFIVVVFIYGPLSNYISVTGGQKYILLSNTSALLLYMTSAFILGFFLKDKKLALGIIYCFVLAESLICEFYSVYLIKNKIYVHFLFVFSPLIVIAISTFFFLHSLRILPNN